MADSWGIVGALVRCAQAERNESIVFETLVSFWLGRPVLPQLEPMRRLIDWKQDMIHIIFTLQAQNILADTYLVQVCARQDIKAFEAIMTMFDMDRDSLMRQCASRGDIAMAKMLVAAGVDLNQVDNEGGTALMCAIDRNQVSMAQFLIDAGCDVTIKDSLGVFPLYASCCKGHLELAKKLYDKAPRMLEERTNHGNRCFLVTVHRGHLDVAKWLVGLGAQTDVKNMYAQTAVMMAANQQTDMLAFVLGLGLPVNALDRFGEGALDRAIRQGKAENVQLLVEWGAVRNVFDWGREHADLDPVHVLRMVRDEDEPGPRGIQPTKAWSRIHLLACIQS